MEKTYKVWFSNFVGCAIGISDINLSVSVVASCESEAIERAMERARAVNRKTGLPPHGIRVDDERLRELATVCPD